MKCVAEFTQRGHSDVEESELVASVLARNSFHDIGDDRKRSAAHLCPELVTFTPGKPLVRKTMDFDEEVVCALVRYEILVW
jgi:hypothetical protein